ncbi:MAG: hypothetical protein CVV42_16530 [Candidatus Riflebacteria bacterium HGW-Riflebacteria-2]|jgi:YHS domain-containing protein|nr:MAG: hypothetical protein CVV42_16530 [Candidatus Riflebacteria bacterium HGW-Riflebacteria-2]
MRKITLVLSLMLAILSFNYLAANEHETLFPNEIIEVLATECPVMGGAIDKAVNTIVGGRLYYFCCSGCISSFEADPEKFQAKLKDAATRTLKVTNVEGKCPVSGLEASFKFFKIDEEAATITFYHD